MKFKIVPLGVGVQKSENGFGGEKGSGDWVCLKCFMEENGNYGEFFINFNPSSGDGEILMKDKNYAPVLEEEFSKEVNGMNMK